MIIVFNVIHKHQSNHSAIKVPKTIYGIGSSRATNAILSIMGSSDLQVRSFNYKALSMLTTIFTRKSFILQKRLLALKDKNIRRLKRVHCYSGLRLKAFLPSSGQRTRSNSMTARYQGSGSFDYAPTRPSANLKRLCHYIRRSPLLKSQSDRKYRQILRRNFEFFKAFNPKFYKQGLKRGTLGIFNKLAGYKKKKVKVKAKK